MSVPTNIRIKIVLLRAKFQSSTVVKRKLWTEFGKNTPGKTTIRETFQRFCETGTVEDRERPGRPSEITEKRLTKLLKLLKMNHNRAFDLFLQPAPFHEQQHIELSLNICH